MLRPAWGRSGMSLVRGNPWNLDRGVVNDDWPYVVFDWDNHFGAYVMIYPCLN